MSCSQRVTFLCPLEFLLPGGRSWQRPEKALRTDGVHSGDNVKPGSSTKETLSEAVKILKFKYCKAAIDKHKMDQAIIFCRTKVDCDNLEQYLMAQGT